MQTKIKINKPETPQEYCKIMVNEVLDTYMKYVYPAVMRQIKEADKAEKRFLRAIK